MIRRLFWLSLGAAVGVTGYRRATALARWLAGPGAGSHAGAMTARTSPGPARARPAPARSASMLTRARQAARFAADVREGMQLYMERHPRRTPNTLESQRARPSRPRARSPLAGRPDHEEDGR